MFNFLMVQREYEPINHALFINSCQMVLRSISNKSLDIIIHFLKHPESLGEYLFQWTLFFSATLFSTWLVYSIFERKVLSLRDKIILR